MTIKDLWAKSVNSIFSYVLFFTILICLLVLPVSPTIVIISAGIIALLYGKIIGEKNSNEFLLMCASLGVNKYDSKIV